MRKLVLVLLAAALLVPQTARSQTKTYWRIPSALGGAMVGAGVGWTGDIMRWSSENCGLCGPSLALTPLGIAVGGAVGFGAGLGADRALARGDSLSTARRRWLRAAAFLTPPALGSTLAFLIINPSPECVPNTFGGCTEEESFADDGTVAFLGIGGGIFLGWILQEKTKGALRPRVNASTGSLGLSFDYAF